MAAIIITSNSIQTALDVLHSIDTSEFPHGGLIPYQLGWLKQELELLLMFYMCGKKWGKGNVRCESFLLTIQDTLPIYTLAIQMIWLRLREDDENPLTNSDSKAFHDLEERINAFRSFNQTSFHQEIKHLYFSFSHASFQTSSSSSSSSSSSQEVHLMDIINYLLRNLRHLLKRERYSSFVSSKNPIQELEENIRFLIKNFILYATVRGLDEHSQQTEHLLTHIEGLVLNASRLIHMFFYYPDRYAVLGEDKEVELIESHVKAEIIQFIKKMKPVESHVRGIYIQVLLASKLSLSSHPPTLTPGEGHKLILGDFVDSLLFLLCDILLSSRIIYTGIFNHQLQNLYDGLKFLRAILRQYRNKFDELYDKMHNLIEVLICEAGILICSLFVEENEEGSAEKLELMFSDLEEKFKLIEGEEGEEYPHMLASYFPRTNMLGFIDSVLEKLDSVSSVQVAFAKDKFRSIHKDLASLRSLLDDDTVQWDQNAKLQPLRSRIGAIAYETEFILDSLVVRNAFQNSVSMPNYIVNEIKLIKIEALETFCSNRHGIKDKELVEANPTMPFVGSIPAFNELVVGLDDEAEMIIDRLTRGTKQRDIVSIVGMPGIGKTTLAKKVYNHLSIIYHFHSRKWCTVSQVYSKKSLLLQILGDDATNHLDKNEDDLASELRRHLKGKTYLIILDDVWDVGAWNCLESSFPNDANGSRILFTSRLRNVALQIKSDSEPHSLRFLTNVESLQLLQKNIGFPPALHALGMKIAQHCKGLPLTILIVSGILSNTKQDAWENVAESLTKGAALDQCMQTLEFSYYHLPDHLKPCFLYFGAFEEDQEIPVRKLLSLWVAEGFVKKTEKECSERVAENYMMDLIQRNLVMVTKKGCTGKVKSCILHDLLRDFCVAKCSEEHFLHCSDGYEVGNSTDPSILYRLRVYSAGEDFADSRLHCPYLRSLFFGANFKTTNERSWYDIMYKYGQSRLVRVLNLRGIRVRNLFPRGIELLVHLRHLAIENYSRLVIPSSIENLQNLETFLVEAYQQKVSLPDTIWNMKKLRHLGTRWDCNWQFPEQNSSNLENLHTLSSVYFSTKERILQKFPNICRLRCRCRFDDEDDMEDVGELKEVVALDFMSKLESLSMYYCEYIYRVWSYQFPRNLKKLLLSGFYQPWSGIAVIEELQNLEILKLQNRAFHGEIWDMEEGKFPKLRFLKLDELDLVKWRASEDSFPRLQKLVLRRCWRFKEVPSSLAYISTLEMVELSECESAISSIQQLEEVQMEVGNEDMKILVHPPHQGRINGLRYN